jgi:hypothetical protein
MTMNITQNFKTALGEMQLGFVLFNGQLHVKIIAAHLFNTKSGLDWIQDITLWHEEGKGYRLPVFSHIKWEEYSKLVQAVLKQIDWKQIEVLLYDAHRLDLKRNLDAKKALRILIEQEEKQLEATLLQTERHAKEGLFQKAASLAQDVIFRLTRTPH